MINSAPREGFTYSPFEAVFGRVPRTPSDVRLDLLSPPPPLQAATNEYLEDIKITIQNIVRSTADSHASPTLKTNKSRDTANLKRKNVDFTTGQGVHILRNAPSRGIKLLSRV